MADEIALKRCPTEWEPLVSELSDAMADYAEYALYRALFVAMEETGIRLTRPTPKADDAMVEGVARAISTKCFAVVDGKDDCCDWDEMSDRAKNVYRDAARAALDMVKEKNDG